MGAVCSQEKVGNLLVDLSRQDSSLSNSALEDLGRDNNGRLERHNGLGHFRSYDTDPEVDIGDYDRWVFSSLPGHQIVVTATNYVQSITVDSKETAIAMLRGQPHRYFGCHWLENGWGEMEAEVFPRACKFYRSGTRPTEPPESFCAMVARYGAIASNAICNNRDPWTEPDGLLMTFKGQQHITKCPGRLQGVADVPGLKVIGNVDPHDIRHGSLGNHWLFAALSSLAEFGPGAIRKLFSSSPDLERQPTNDFNMYTVTLYDLDSWTQTDVDVDERLPWNEAKSSLVGCPPTRTGEIWPCLLEKAVAVHCGGWDFIQGGNVAHAWHLLTGCKEVYTIKRRSTNRYSAFGAYNPTKRVWTKMANSPHDPTRRKEGSNTHKAESFQGLWPMHWPEVGGRGGRAGNISREELFSRMCAWDDANYMMVALSDKGVQSAPKQKGKIVGHMYTIRRVLDNCGDSGLDMIELRARRGVERPQLGGWGDDGPNWLEYPQVQEACGAGVRDDSGIFWTQKEEFFDRFHTIYLCAMSMRAWLQDGMPFDIGCSIDRESTLWKENTYVSLRDPSLPTTAGPSGSLTVGSNLTSNCGFGEEPAAGADDELLREMDKARLQAIISSFAKQAMEGVSCTALEEGTGACARARYRLTQDVQYLIINLLRDASPAELKCPLRSIQDIYAFAEDGPDPFEDHVLDRVEAAGLDRDLLLMVMYGEESGVNASFCLLMENNEHRNVFMECIRMATIYALNYHALPVKEEAVVPHAMQDEAVVPLAIQDEATAGLQDMQLLDQRHGEELGCDHLGASAFAKELEHGFPETSGFAKDIDLETSEARRPQAPRLCCPVPHLSSMKEPQGDRGEELECDHKEALADEVQIDEPPNADRSQWASSVQVEF